MKRFLSLILASAALLTGALAADSSYTDTTTKSGTTGTSALFKVYVDPTNGALIPYIAITGTLPLPTGGATSAKQDTGNASLATIAAAFTITAGNDATSTAVVGTDWTALATHTAKQATIINTTGTAISVRYGSGTGISLPTGTGYTFRGLTNSNGLQIKRTDDSNTQVSVSYNWENF